MLEAMSAGCALVASDVEPAREAVGPGAARLVDHRNIEALADSILTVRGLPLWAHQRGALS